MVIYAAIVYGLSLSFGRAISDQDPLHVLVAAISHRCRFLRRYAAFLLATAAVATTSNIYNGLYYPVVEAITTTVIRALLLRYTEDVDIEVGSGVEATQRA
jgi:hypothetical protein